MPKVVSPFFSPHFLFSCLRWSLFSFDVSNPPPFFFGYGECTRDWKDHKVLCVVSEFVKKAGENLDKIGGVLTGHDRVPF